MGVEVELRDRLVEESRRAHSNWFGKFSQSDIELLSSIGLYCGANHDFFKQEILNIFDALRSRKLKKYPRLYQCFIKRYLDLIPEHIRAQVDRKLLVEDQYYCAWFFNRQMFIFNYLVAKDNFICGFSKKSYLHWAPLIDKQTPSECCDFQNKIFHVSDPELEILAVKHWSIPRKGCRCSLISTNKPKKEMRVNKIY